MDQDSPIGLTRRQTLHRALGAAAGVAIVWVAGRGSALAATSKLAKSAVKYVDAGNVEGRDCDDCSQFVVGKTAKDIGTCKIVEGDINPNGHCIAFSPKPKS